MIKNWQSHQDYLNFLHEAKIHFDSSQRVRLAGEFVVAREKLRLLNLDPVMELLDPYDPPLGSYYDFIDRLWLQEKHFQKSRRKDLFSADKNRKPANKPGKGKKLPNRHPEITKIIAEEAVSRDEFPFYYEKLLQQVFCAAAVTPSMQCGLINKGGVTLSGDGTCVHTHASPYGHKVYGCPDHGQNRCDCARHYSDPDAHWGWDSDLGTFYFGYTLYMLSYHDSQLGIDLPFHIRFLDARRHDSVSGIVTLKEFRGLNPDIPIQNLCFDSANDNYPTYNLCKTWDVRPFIDLNAKRGMPKSIPDEIMIDKDGTPICQAGHRMVYWGYCSGRSRCKWRCPLACRKVDACPCRDKCSKSPYGQCVYTKPDWDARLYPRLPGARGNIKKFIKTAHPVNG